MAEDAAEAVWHTAFIRDLTKWATVDMGNTVALDGEDEGRINDFRAGHRAGYVEGLRRGYNDAPKIAEKVLADVMAGVREQVNTEAADVRAALAAVRSYYHINDEMLVRALVASVQVEAAPATHDETPT